MKSRKHKSKQIIKKLREADAILASGKTIGQVPQALEISEQTFHRWRNQYGGLKAENLCFTLVCPEGLVTQRFAVMSDTSASAS